MPAQISYKSYCWGLGTTSFRTKSFNRTIEEQLALLDEFWAMPEHATVQWSSNTALQVEYYYFMQLKGFVTGDAPRKDKDAREKTSGLVDIGLISDERRLTGAGQALLRISREGDFSSDNSLQIPRDSYIYLRQLLKTTTEGFTVRPFIILLHLLRHFDYLTLDEFTYLLPLCTDMESTEKVMEGIAAVRSGNAETTIDDIIIDHLMGMDNYQTALHLLLHNEVNEALICEVGINRKSRRYDKPYYPLYEALFSLFVDHNEDAVIAAFRATKDVNIGIWWRSMLFDTSSERAIRADPWGHLKLTPFNSVDTEREFKTVFFKVMHLLKAKATLRDYCDLNRRYIRTTDTVLFADEQVRLDIIPKQYFGMVDEELYALAYTPAENLFENCQIEQILPGLRIDEATIIDGINAEYGAHAATIDELHQLLEDDRYERLDRLINEKFSEQQLLQLLDDFEQRNDAEIAAMVTNDADIPTIFEYVLGIAWYKVSERRGRVLDYMKLSLDADLLPKTHAAGGEADIVYEYDETEVYPAHTLLIEATLADGTNQRRMEMEPVSRHLGQHILRTREIHSYCIFITPYLDLNVLSDFCSRRTAVYYEPTEYRNWDDANKIPGMNIIPLRTEELKSLIRSHMTYKELYPSLSVGYFNFFGPPHRWYKEKIASIWDNR